MEKRQLGTLWPVSALTLGGGGIGQVWGATTRGEAVATVRAAAEADITLFDIAPGYGRGEAESVMGEAFDGNLPSGSRVTTKVQLGTLPRAEAEQKIRSSLARSLATMKIEKVDLFFLHSNIIPDEFRFPDDEVAATQDRFATTWQCYTESVVPVFSALQDEGLIGNWGITGIGLPETIISALQYETKPQAVQCIANCLDSAGGIRRFAEEARPRDIIAAAAKEGVAVLGIRAVQAGALTDAVDRELPDGSADLADFNRAEPLRALAGDMGVSTAVLAHRYALGMDDVDTVVLGVKNRHELAECVAAAEDGPLDQSVVEKIDALFR